MSILSALEDGFRHFTFFSSSHTPAIEAATNHLQIAEGVLDTEHAF